MRIALGMEMSSLLIAVILLAGLAIILLTRIGEKVTRVSYFVWGVISVCTIVPALLFLVGQMTGRFEEGCIKQGVFLLWSSILDCFGIVAVRYARRYKKQILGIYALITAGMTLVAMCMDPFSMVAKEVPEELFIAINNPLLLAGYSAMAILFSLFIVAEKRPIKVKRWIRVSFLLLGLGILVRAIGEYRSYAGESIWSWRIGETVTLLPWLVLCINLHGKNTYTKDAGIIPIALSAVGMLLTLDRARWAVLLLVPLLIAGVVAGYKKGVIKVPNVWEMDTMGKFRILTYGYAAVLMGAVMVQSIVRLEAWKGFNTMVTIFYVVAITALFLWNKERMSKLKCVAVLVWNTLLTMVVVLFFAKLDMLRMVVFWILLFPVTFFLIQGRSAVKSQYEVSHLLAFIAMLGLVGSYGCGPFIYLFWIGGFLFFAYFVWGLVRRE